MYAVKAARQAGTRTLELSKGATCNWADIMKDGKFVLPTSVERGPSSAGFKIALIKRYVRRSERAPERGKRTRR